MLDLPIKCIPVDILRNVTRRGRGIKPASINCDLTCLSGMFTTLIDAELFFGEHPFREMKKLKEQKPETGYLTQEEITLLLANFDGDNKKIAILCLSTGARSGEAAKLKAENIIQNRVTFVKTKTNKPRTVPISEEVAVMIAVRFICSLMPHTRSLGEQ